jgi:hypothetical protein
MCEPGGLCFIASDVSPYITKEALPIVQTRSIAARAVMAATGERDPAWSSQRDGEIPRCV